MKVIFVCTKSITFNTFLKSQAEYYIRKGHEVIVACVDSYNLDFKNSSTYMISFPTTIFDMFNLLNYIKIYFQIRKLVNKNQLGIFYLHTPLASHIFRLFNYFKNLNIIYFVHGFRFTPTSNFIKNMIFITIEKILSHKTNIFITINNHDYNYAKLKLVKKNLCYKICGVGVILSANKDINNTIIKKTVKKILVIAAYKKDKGYSEILKVAELLKDHDIKIECFGYGKFNKYEKIKIKRSLKNISFNSFDSDLKNKIKNFDILLHLSKREGLPVSIIESLSQGLPVICYNIRGNNDLIKNKINGYFVKSYKEVPKKILYLKLKESIYHNMSLEAYKTINENFSNKNINLKTLEIIEKYNQSLL